MEEMREEKCTFLDEKKRKSDRFETETQSAVRHIELLQFDSDDFKVLC